MNKMCKRFDLLEIGTVLRYIGDDPDFIGAITTVQGFDRVNMTTEGPVRTDLRLHMDEMSEEFINWAGHSCHQPAEDNYKGFYVYASEMYCDDDSYGLDFWEIVDVSFWRL